jgi:hypothetical protein
MSIVHLLAYDYPLPEVDMRIFKEKFISKTTVGLIQGFSVQNCYYSKDINIEIANSITKQYCYDLGLTEEDFDIENLWKIIIKSPYLKKFQKMNFKEMDI